MPKGPKKPKAVEAHGLKGYPKQPRPDGGAQDGRWYWQFGRYVARRWQSVPKSAGWYTREEAQRFLLDLPDRRTGRPAGQIQTMEQLLMVWLGHQKGRQNLPGQRGTLNPATYKAYRQQVKLRVAPSIGTTLITRFSTKDLEGLRDDLTAKGFAGTTVKHALAVTRLAWDFGRKTGLCPQRELGRVSAPNLTPKNNQRCPTTEEATKAFEHLPTKTELQRRRTRLLFLFIWYTGARVQEAAQIEWRDIDLWVPSGKPNSPPGGSATLRRKGKKGEKRVATIDLHPALLAELRQHHAETGGRGRLVIESVSGNASGQGLRRDITKACKAANIPRFTPHGLRRLAGTVLIEAGVGKKTYEAIMGHSYEQMGMKIYAQSRRPGQRSAVSFLGPASTRRKGRWTAPDLISPGQLQADEVEDLREDVATLQEQLRQALAELERAKASD